jgi:hypothetical protein
MRQARLPAAYEQSSKAWDTELDCTVARWRHYTFCTPYLDSLQVGALVGRNAYLRCRMPVHLARHCPRFPDSFTPRPGGFPISQVLSKY